MLRARRATSASCLTSSRRHACSSPTPATDHVLRADERPQAIGDHEHYLVAHLVTVRVVDALEVVDVDEEDRKSPTVPTSLNQPVVEALVEQRPAGQTGEWVVKRELQRIVLARLGFREIVLRCGQVGFRVGQVGFRVGQFGLDAQSLRDLHGKRGIDLSQVVSGLHRFALYVLVLSDGPLDGVSRAVRLLALRQQRRDHQESPSPKHHESEYHQRKAHDCKRAINDGQG